MQRTHRRPAVALLVLSLLLPGLVLPAGLVLPVQGLHSGSALHGTPATVADAAMTLWLHCTPFQDPTDPTLEDNCRTSDPFDPSERTLDGSEPPDREGATPADEGELEDPVGEDDVLRYTFRTGPEGTDYAFRRDFRVTDARATLFFQWTGDWEVEAKLVAVTDADDADGGTTLATVTQKLNASAIGGADRVERTFTFTRDGSFDLPRGHNLRLELRADRTSLLGDAPKLLLDDDSVPSRIAFRGALVTTRAWTHDDLGNPQRAFPLDLPARDRQVHATLAVISAFGEEGLDPAAADLTITAPDGSEAATIGYVKSPARSADSRIVHFLEEPWAFDASAEPGTYTAVHAIETNGGTDVTRTTTFVLGRAVGIDTVGPVRMAVRPGHNATYRVTLTNRADEALDLQVTGQGLPVGWTLRIEPDRFVVPAGGERDVEIVVVPALDAEPGDEGVLDLTALPVGRPDLDSSEVELTTEVAASVRHRPRLLFRGVTDGFFVVEDGVAVVDFTPGQRRTVEVDVVNNGTVRDRFHLGEDRIVRFNASSTFDPTGWRVTFDDADVTLDPGQRTTVTAEVTAGSEEDLGERFKVFLKAQATDALDREGLVRFDARMGAVVDFEAAAQRPVRDVTEDAGNALVRLTLTNRGNVNVTVTPGNVELAPGQVGEVVADVDLDCANVGAGATTTAQHLLTGEPPDDVAAEPRNRTVTVRANCVIDGDRSAVLVEPRPPVAGDGTLLGPDGRTARFPADPYPCPLPRDRRPALSCDFAVAEPGQNVTFPVRVSNVGTRDNEDFTLSVPTGPQEWNLTAPFVLTGEDPADEDAREATPEIDNLDSWENDGATPFSTSYNLTLTVPENASAGKHEFVVVAASTGSPDAAARHVYTVEVVERRGAAVAVPEEDLETTPGTPALFTVAVQNTGNAFETFELELDASGLPGDWTVNASAVDDVTVPPRDRRLVTVGVEPPADAAAGETGPVTLRVAAGFGFEREVTLTAVVRQASPDVRLSSDLPLADARPGATVSFPVRVRNVGDGEVQVDLATSRTPEGFDVTVLRGGTETSFVNLLAGASTTVDVEVTVPAGTLAESRVGLNLYARVRDGDASELAALPLEVQVLRSVGVRLAPDEKAKVTPAGDTATYVVTVRNTGTATDTFLLSAQPGPSGWSVTLDRPSITLLPRQSGAFLLRVTPSAQVPAGTAITTLVDATSLADPQVRTLLQVETETLLRDVAFAGGTSMAAAPGETLTAAPVLLNEGNADDRFELVVLDAPEGWTVTPGLAVTVGPGERAAVPLDIDVPLDVDQDVFGVSVRAQARTDATVHATTTVLVRIADFTTLDVDDDGLDEVALDRNGDDADGLEAFTEVHTGSGVATTLVKSARFSETVPTGFILLVRDTPRALYRFWSPADGVLTDTVRAPIVAPDRPGFPVDVDGDGVVEFLYDEGTDEVLRAVSLGDRTGWVADGDDSGSFGDSDLDVFYDPQTGVRTRVGDHVGDDVAVDTDGDGLFDVLVEASTGRTRTYTVLDAMTVTAVDHWPGFLAFVAVLAAAGAALYWRGYRKEGSR